MFSAVPFVIIQIHFSTHMNKHTPPSRVNAETTDLPIARLDAQDMEQSLSIREYLERNGCAVIYNRKPAIQETYHIITGDIAYVKHTLATHATNDVVPFLVLFLKQNDKFLPEHFPVTAKIAAVDGNSIQTRDVVKLFAYFLTSDEPTLYLEGEGNPVATMKPVERIQEETDANRLSQTISDMFKSEDQKIDRIEDLEKIGQKEGTSEKLEIGETRTRSTRKKKMKWWHIALLGISIVIAPVLWYGMSLTMITVAQRSGMQGIKERDIPKVVSMTNVSRYWVEQGKGALMVAGIPFGVFGGSKVIRNQERMLSVIGDIITAQKHISELTALTQQFTPMLLGSTQVSDEIAGSIPALVDRLRLLTDSITSSLGLVVAQLRLMRTEQGFPFALPRVEVLIDRAESQLTSILGRVTSLSNLLTLYRVTGGFDGKKKYLVLLQNSMELRPTGGFIGSIATVTVEDGIIATPIVQDVYALDGQLRGHVDPPVPIQDLLEQEHWYLRDSNWDPDFRGSGQKAAWFYEKESGTTVDGVIAISSPFFTELLGATGPLNLSDYNDKITKENFFGKSLFYTKADFFPGSTQKKDFLGSLTVSLLGKLASKDSSDFSATADVLSSALGHGDIQFWFPQEQAQSIVEQAGWAGAMSPTMSCELSVPACTIDRMSIVESNMGVNKVNFYIKRQIKNRVDVDNDGVISGTIAITYQNESGDDSALSGGGVYLTYLRLYLPRDAEILSARLEGNEIGEKATNRASRSIPYREIGETTDGVGITGIAFSVPPGLERSLIVTYQRGIGMVFQDGSASFVHSIRKQAGMTNTALETIIGYPSSWKAETERSLPLTVSNGFLANMNELRYNTDLDQSKKFVITFRK